MIGARDRTKASIRHSRRQPPIHRSMIAFARGARTGLRKILSPASANIRSKAAVNFVSRSRDQERDRFRMLTEFHDQVPGRLGHPPVVWVGGDAKDPHPLEGVFDDGEDVDGGAVEQGDGEEVGR